jgi:hypothetical protein
MIINKLYNTNPKFIHASGKEEFLPLWEQIRKKEFNFSSRLPKELTIVTYNNGVEIGYNNKKNGTFENSLIKAGITNFIVLGQGIKNWMNKLKIELLKKTILEIKTEYILSSDSSDVLLVNDLNDLIPKFENLNCKMIFNAEKNIWPTDLPDEIINFEKSTANSNIFPFLNAGLWMGKTNFIKTKLAEINKYKFHTKHSMSEQIYYKFLYFEAYPKIILDYKCEIFQNINRVDETILTI